MKKRLHLAVISVGMIIASVAGYLWLRPPAADQPIIAVFTTLSHPALEQVDEGFKSAIGRTYKTISFNAQGNAQQANMIASQIAQNPDVIGILAVGSLAAQTIAKAEKQRPIIFAAVSDPSVILPDQQNANVFGLTDAIDPDFQISSILDVLPQTKSLSILYSPHETNSSAVVKKLLASAHAIGLRVEEVAVYEPQQVTPASHAACSKADVMLLPLDNQLAASMPSVIKATKNLNCTVIISDQALIKHGAAFAFGVNYQELGSEAARLLHEVITNKKTPIEIGYINPKNIGLYMNKRVVDDKNIKVNTHSRNKITVIDGNQL